jgi:hypothetical protein
MTIPDILKELGTYTGAFPMAAMKAAVEQREAIIPELVGVLESVARDPAGWAARRDDMLPLFALYLLAQFREKRAYRSVVEIAGAPAGIVDELLGDTLTEGLSQILGSVYDGDPTPSRSSLRTMRRMNSRGDRLWRVSWCLKGRVRCRVIRSSVTSGACSRAG